MNQLQGGNSVTPIHSNSTFDCFPITGQIEVFPCSTWAIPRRRCMKIAFRSMASFGNPEQARAAYRVIDFCALKDLIELADECMGIDPPAAVSRRALDC